MVLNSSRESCSAYNCLVSVGPPIHHRLRLVSYSLQTHSFDDFLTKSILAPLLAWYWQLTQHNMLFVVLDQGLSDFCFDVHNILYWRCHMFLTAPMLEKYRKYIFLFNLPEGWLALGISLVDCSGVIKYTAEELCPYFELSQAVMSHHHL